MQNINNRDFKKQNFIFWIVTRASAHDYMVHYKVIFFSDDDKDEDEDSLLINVIEEGNAMLSNLQILNLQPQVCLRDRDSAYKPINLYHKVGHGKLDMYVINPSKEAKEIREFMERWNGENSKTLGK